ncbi:unnamed protein product [Pedinophyceae sp. YPF-701]|nr:unnamed protein product [Pedinophyceae sp. YPF-701]
MDADTIERWLLGAADRIWSGTDGVRPLPSASERLGTNGCTAYSVFSRTIVTNDEEEFSLRAEDRIGSLSRHLAPSGAQLHETTEASPAARREQDSDDNKTIVVLLHGLARTSRCMRPIAHYLWKEEGWSAICVGYPSRRYRLSELVSRVDALIREELATMGVELLEDRRPKGGARLLGVTHSLGGIIIRHLSQKLHFERICMLAPPNQGSTVARQLLARGALLSSAVERLYGPVIHDLAAPHDEAQQWPVPPCPVGIIMGTRRTNAVPTSWVTTYLDMFQGHVSDGTVTLIEGHLGKLQCLPRTPRPSANEDDAGSDRGESRGESVRVSGTSKSRAPRDASPPSSPNDRPRGRSSERASVRERNRGRSLRAPKAAASHVSCLSFLSDSASESDGDGAGGHHRVWDEARMDLGDLESYRGALAVRTRGQEAQMVTVDATHTFIMADPKVHELVLAFLKRGTFSHVHPEVVPRKSHDSDVFFSAASAPRRSVELRAVGGAEDSWEPRGLEKVTTIAKAKLGELRERREARVARRGHKKARRKTQKSLRSRRFFDAIEEGVSDSDNARAGGASFSERRRESVGAGVSPLAPQATIKKKPARPPWTLIGAVSRLRAYVPSFRLVPSRSQAALPSAPSTQRNGTVASSSARAPAAHSRSLLARLRYGLADANRKSDREREPGSTQKPFLRKSLRERFRRSQTGVASQTEGGSRAEVGQCDADTPSGAKRASDGSGGAQEGPRGPAEQPRRATGSESELRASSGTSDGCSASIVTESPDERSGDSSSDSDGAARADVRLRDTARRKSALEVAGVSTPPPGGGDGSQRGARGASLHEGSAGRERAAEDRGGGVLVSMWQRVQSLVSDTEGGN